MSSTAICGTEKSGKSNLKDLNLKEPRFSLIEFFGFLFVIMGLLVWAVFPPKFDVSLLRHEPALLAERLLARSGAGEQTNTSEWVGVLRFEAESVTDDAIKKLAGKTLPHVKHLQGRADEAIEIINKKLVAPSDMSLEKKQALQQRLAFVRGSAARLGEVKKQVELIQNGGLAAFDTLDAQTKSNLTVALVQIDSWVAGAQEMKLLRAYRYDMNELEV